MHLHRGMLINQDKFYIKIMEINKLDNKIASIKDLKNVNAIKYTKIREAVEIADVADVATLQAIEDTNTPLIPNNVFEDLPDILKSSTKMFDDPRQRDIYLTGALGIFSGCIQSVSGYYHNSRLYPNLYVFITAPAASGKGALAHTRSIGNKYHEELKSIKTDGAKKLLFIPGNSSSAAIMTSLEQNGGKGIFFETEADSLSNTFKNDWGNFSDFLRKSFHHEPVSYSRKNNNELIEIDEPKLSVVLSGTPHQVKALVKDAEDGLFSRILFYSFKSNAKWEDVSPKTGDRNIFEHFEKLKTEAYQVIITLNQYESINFELQKHHWNELNSTQESVLQYATNNFNNNASSLVKRMGVMWFRIAMLLTALRNYTGISENESLICSDIDFRLAKDLISTYKEHIFEIYSTLSTSNNDSINELDYKLLSLLPAEEFNRKDLIKIGETLGLKTRKLDDCISLYQKEKFIKKVKHGIFIKIK